jgi:hypothetical protein
MVTGTAGIAAGVALIDGYGGVIYIITTDFAIGGIAAAAQAITVISIRFRVTHIAARTPVARTKRGAVNVIVAAIIIGIAFTSGSGRAEMISERTAIMTGIAFVINQTGRCNGRVRAADFAVAAVTAGTFA